jgi:hypothetical protein
MPALQVVAHPPTLLLQDLLNADKPDAKIHADWSILLAG